MGAGLDDMQEILAGYSLEQIDHYRACRRAVEHAGAPPAMEYEKRELTVEERLYRTAEDFRSWGAPEDLIGQDLAWKLVKLGHSTDEAEELLRSVGVTWSPGKVS
jgi:hypothetical protein